MAWIETYMIMGIDEDQELDIGSQGYYFRLYRKDYKNDSRKNMVSMRSDARPRYSNPAPTGCDWVGGEEEKGGDPDRKGLQWGRAGSADERMDHR